MFGPEIIVKTYRMPIAATPAQISAFCQISGCCRLVYNWALDWRKAHIATSPRDENGKISPLSKNDQLNGLPALKKIRTFLKDCPSQALQAAIGDLHEGVVGPERSAHLASQVGPRVVPVSAGRSVLHPQDPQGGDCGRWDHLPRWREVQGQIPSRAEVRHDPV
jgi:hypothetical protein